MATDTERRRPVAWLAWLVALAAVPACGPPQVSAPNREIVLGLATATSAEQPEWLEQCARLIEAREAEGKLTEAERAALDPILADARAGRWEEARDRAYALRDAQEPTPEEVEAVRKRTLPEPKSPPGARSRR